MKNKLPHFLYGSWFLSLTLLLAFSASSFAQSQMMNEEQIEAERTRQQVSSPAGVITGQTSNRPMAAGETCDDAIVVTTLPFDDAGNTSDYGDNYSSGDVPAVAPGAITTGTGSTSYLNGDDVVYAYTPANDEVLNISTTNDDDWIGLWAFTGCPFTSTVGYHTSTSGDTRLIEELPVTAGETYYFVISTWPAPQSTDYTILIEKVGGGGGGHVYCIPEGTNSARYIDNFSTTGGNDNISNMGSGFSTDGYGDFYDTHSVAQAQGEDVEFSVDIVGGTAGFRVWVDWNQDGVFDTTEEVAYESSSYSADHTGTITVPADALEGDTRMRIVSHWLNSSGNIDPCETGFTYGEFEDYKFTVEEGGGTTSACEQDYYMAGMDPVDYPTGIGFSGANIVANDVVIDPNSTFEPHTLTFDMILLDGTPTDFTMQMYQDNGSGGVGNEEGPEYALTPADYTATFIGNWNGSYPIYSIEVDILAANIVLENSTNDPVYYWIGISSELSSTGDFVYWNSYDYDNNPSNPTWQYTTDDGWFAYDGGSSEGGMLVEGECTSGGGGGGGFVCDDQFNDSNAIENGLFFGGTTNQRMAIDIIAGDDGFTAYGSNLNIFLAAGQTTDDLTFDFIFYDDDTGAPGNEVHSSSGTVHSSEYVGENFGYDVYTFEVEFDNVADFDPNTTYWMEVESNGEAWETSTVGTFGSKMAFNNDNTGGDWSIDSTNDAVYSLICEDFGTPPASDCITTIYDAGNNGSPGGAVYFDITVGAEDIELTSIDLNIDDSGTSFSVDVYTLEGTYVGNETNQGAWTLQTEGSGTSAGEGNPSSATLDDTFTLSANTTYGMALIMDASHSHYYTNGDGSNEHFENNDLELDLGAATNAPFTPGVFDPRVFNGGLCYNVGGGGGGHIYCIPEGTNSSRFIDNFSTTGGDDNISNMGSGFSPGGYGDFYDTHKVTQAQGETVQFTVDIEGGISGFRVWVDWNQDGVFDITEEVAYTSSSYENSHTGTITVPADAMLGNTRMRIVSHWLSTTGDVDPCETGFTYGEFEDYKFTVEEGLGIDDQSTTTFSYYPNPTNGVVNITANKDISSLALFNILGQQVLEMDRLDNGQVDVSNLATGTYMFRLTFEDGSTEIFKILKE